MIQVRNVPEALHRELVRRARARGQTLTDYIQELLEREVSRPPAAEIFERIRTRPAVELNGPVSDVLREERDDGEGRGKGGSHGDRGHRE